MFFFIILYWLIKWISLRNCHLHCLFCEKAKQNWILHLPVRGLLLKLTKRQRNAFFVAIVVVEGLQLGGRWAEPRPPIFWKIAVNPFQTKGRQIMPTTLLLAPPSDFQTFLRLCHWGFGAAERELKLTLNYRLLQAVVSMCSFFSEATAVSFRIRSFRNSLQTKKILKKNNFRRFDYFSMQ